MEHKHLSDRGHCHFCFNSMCDMGTPIKGPTIEFVKKNSLKLFG